MMNRSKPLFFNSFKEVRTCMSTKAKPPNHYETLNVNQDCTQEEIKSAYYDLTKKYHPDRNTTKEAKVQFQNVSDAYEVLGNFHRRKLYDRDLSARGSAAANNKNYSVPEDKMAGFYRSRTTNDANTENFQNYDFDAWTRAHYEKTFYYQSDRSKRIRDRVNLRSSRRHKDEDEVKFTVSITSLAMGVILVYILLEAAVAENFDRDRRPKKKGINS